MTTPADHFNRAGGSGGESDRRNSGISVVKCVSNRMSKLKRVITLAALCWLAVCASPSKKADLILRGGLVFDGAGAEPYLADVVVSEGKIVFVGEAGEEGFDANETIEVGGLMVTPGFIDMHSHAELDKDWGRDGRPFLHQGITTAVLGVDGGGSPEVADQLSRYAKNGIGLNALVYVGHGAVRRRVMGMDQRKPSETELESMKALVDKAMREGALGLSTGLFYIPGAWAETGEVIELAKSAQPYQGIYDTHDRDLGAAYQGIGYLNSIREAIRIGEESGCRVIFSHFNAQGAHNYGRAPEGARLVEEARARGVEVAAAQHVYTATQSSLRAYAIPRWASAGGDEEMVRRFDEPKTVARLNRETMEMLKIRGGAEKILFADPRPDLNGKTLAQAAAEKKLSVPETVRAILREANAAVMNLDLYDIENTRYLAGKDWMMTCTDGRTPEPGQKVTHPRVYGAFTLKLTQFVLTEGILTMPRAIRSMSGLAADFLHLKDRGYLKPGMAADIAVLDRDRLSAKATYEDPHHYAEGAVHVLVNGQFAIRDSRFAGVLAGRPLQREGTPFAPPQRVD